MVLQKQLYFMFRAASRLVNTCTLRIRNIIIWEEFNVSNKRCFDGNYTSSILSYYLVLKLLDSKLIL